MAQQLVTLAAAVIGALLGLAAPLVANSIARRDRDVEAQRQIATQIFEIFDSAEPLPDVLALDESGARRRLYLLSLRLRSESARVAVMRVVAISGGRPVDNDELHEAWFVMMDEVGRLWRQTSKLSARHV
ncbi:hypothetical protein ACFPJ1_16430 [Kribbella qitaiheensis]|uniref:hypothetical protein n=1 Tax=Kribbella qitaiheensis TaxID=1544730 RepID=UPI00361E8664